ncbi:XRE family transcriptional regulator [Bailinhaonella thermotolerans]|uniref:XRE family transcriptional regulator n=2 Tax=Bailinhaonella thermotolerans TaxID=1070861 RepID=A0A3A4ATG4_9ACTN|nr:XRE family transcriptional regulator [Bailinhaonella thermotolerans]
MSPTTSRSAPPPTSPKDTAALLDVYQVDAGDRSELLELARTGRRKGWWTAYGDLLPEYATYIGLEAEATFIRSFDAVTINGLMQTEDYAREIIRSAVMGLSSPAEVERRVKVRITRQSVVTRDDDPLRLWSVIDEHALRRPVGSPQIMEAQYAKLLKMTERDNVGVQVLPASVGAHPGTAGMFTILEFGELRDPDVVYVEAMTSSLFVESDPDVYMHALAFDHLRSKAMSPEESPP